MLNNNNPFEMFDFQKVLSATKIPNVDVNSENYIDAQKTLKPLLVHLKLYLKA